MAIKRGTKGFNFQEVNEIQLYVLGLGQLLNKNMKQYVTMNPRGVRVALAELKLIQEEIAPVEVELKDVDVNRCLVTKEDMTEVEKFLWNNPAIVSSGLGKLKQIQQAEIYDLKNPKTDREAKIDEMEAKIEKYTEINLRLKALGAGQDVERNERQIEKLEAEIYNIRLTFDVPTIEEIQFEMFSFADAKLNGIKNQVDEAINYLEGVQA